MDNQLNDTFKVSAIKTSGKIFSKVLLKETNQRVTKFLRDQNWNFISEICDLDHRLEKESISLNHLVEDLRSNRSIVFHDQINNVLNNLVDVDFYTAQIFRMKNYLQIHEPDFTLAENEKKTLEEIDELSSKINDLENEIGQGKQEENKILNITERLNKKKDYISSCSPSNTNERNFSNKESIQINEKITKLKQEIEEHKAPKIEPKIVTDQNAVKCCILLDFNEHQLESNINVKLVQLEPKISTFSKKLKFEIDESLFGIKDIFNSYFILISKEYDSIKLDLKQIDKNLSKIQQTGKINVYLRTNTKNMNRIEIPKDLKVIKVVRSSEISLKRLMGEIEDLNKTCDKEQFQASNFELDNVKRIAIEKLEQSMITNEAFKQPKEALNLREEIKAKNSKELENIEQILHQNENKLDLLKQNNHKLINDLDFRRRLEEELIIKKEKILQRLENEKPLNLENNSIAWLIMNMNLFEKLLNLLKKRKDFLEKNINSLNSNFENESNENFLFKNRDIISKLGQLASSSYMYEEDYF